MQMTPYALTELDGNQTLDFYWLDPVETAKRLVGKKKFAGKLYYQFEREDSVQRPGKRAFGRANSGTVFQSAQLIDMFSVPLLLLLYADKTFSGAHATHHPIYCKCNFSYFTYFAYFANLAYSVYLAYFAYFAYFFFLI